jgi:ABC-type dipeptide/oligopeptide/nickel transport system permease component
MAAYLLRRLIQSALILLGVSFITFFLLYVLPADPVRQIAGRAATAETVENIRAQLGLDQPFLVQYGRYLAALAQGDLGRSYLQKTEVTELILSRLPATLQLMAAGIVAELILGLSMGIAAALMRGRLGDQLLMMTSFITVSAPQFVVSLLLLLCLRGQARLVPHRRLRHGGPSGSSRPHLGNPRFRLVFPHDAIVDDRGLARRLHPHRPGQGAGPRASWSAMRCPTPSCLSSP